MDDMKAFERLIADVAVDAAGPPRPVDVMTIVRAATTAPDRWSVVERRLRGNVSPALMGLGFRLFPALRFVAAAAFVALIGGFLVSGVLTTREGDEMLPAAVTTSASPETDTDAPVGPTIVSSPTTTEELLLGMVTEEVEPGVIRVLNDGVRDLEDRSGQLIAGHDGSIWLLDRKYVNQKPRNQFMRLGEEGVHEPPKVTSIEAFEVAPDGTIWAVTRSLNGKSQLLRSYDRERWKVWSPTDDRAYVLGVAVASDGTVWASWQEPGTGDPLEDWPEKAMVGMVGSDGWQRIGPVADRGGYPSELFVTASGEPILHSVSVRPMDAYATRYRDDAWQDVLEGYGVVGVGSDGVVWFLPWHEEPEFDPSDGSLVRFPYTSDGTLLRVDGDERREWGPIDGVPVFRYLYKAWPRDLEIAPDGSLWVTHPLAPPTLAPPDCEGVVRFDGETWSRFLTSHCIAEIAIAADGSVWANGWIQDDEGNRGSPYYTYVIRPEAAAGDPRDS